ncbi:MAG: proton-conducting transporter membrane subunit [Halanaerobiaceae bacterium]
MHIPGLIYLLGALLLVMTEKTKKQHLLAVIISGIALICTFFLTPGSGYRITFMQLNLQPVLINSVNRFVAVIFSLSGFFSLIYSYKIASKRNLKLILIYIGSSLMVILAGDLFTFYIFWELMTVSSYFLIYNKNIPGLERRCYYYFIMHMVGGLALLWGILLQYTNAGNLLLTNISHGIPFFMLAIGIKLAFIGLHTWLPKNYSQVNFYVSVVLSAFTTKAGVYAFYKLTGGLGLAYAGVLSALIGVIFALRQTKARKLLSYHIISQVGYMIAGIGIGTATGYAGGLFHLFNHILYKGLLFMVIGVVIYTTGEEDLSKLGGLAGKLPLTTTAGIIAALAIAGMPFFNGHISKLIIKKSLNTPFLSWGLYITGIGTSLSFIKFIYFTFFHKNLDIKLKKQPPLSMKLSMLIVSLTIILLGLKPLLLENLYNYNPGINYFRPLYIWQGFQPTLLAIPVFFITYRIIIPRPHDRGQYPDLYSVLGRMFSTFGSYISNIHNGNLGRYIIWSLNTLAIIWLKIKFLF